MSWVHCLLLVCSRIRKKKYYKHLYSAHQYRSFDVSDLRQIVSGGGRKELDLELELEKRKGWERRGGEWRGEGEVEQKGGKRRGRIWRIRINNLIVAGFYWALLCDRQCSQKYCCSFFVKRWQLRPLSLFKRKAIFWMLHS